MPGAKPTKAAIANVIEAMKAAGLEPKEVKVAADGGFTVATQTQIDQSGDQSGTVPRKFGAAR